MEQNENAGNKLFDTELSLIYYKCIYPCFLYHNKYTYEMGIYEVLMKFLTGKSHTAVGMMTVSVCSITVTERLTGLSIRRIYTLGGTVYASKSTFTR